MYYIIIFDNISKLDINIRKPVKVNLLTFSLNHSKRNKNRHMNFIYIF